MYTHWAAEIITRLQGQMATGVDVSCIEDASADQRRTESEQRTDPDIQNTSGWTGYEWIVFYILHWINNIYFAYLCISYIC